MKKRHPWRPDTVQVNQHSDSVILRGCSRMDLDPLVLVKQEEDYKDAVVKEEPLDECESVAPNMTECDPSKCDVTEQFSPPSAPSTEQEVEQGGLLVPKQEQPDVKDECASETEELDEIAFVAVKEEPLEDFPYQDDSTGTEMCPVTTSVDIAVCASTSVNNKKRAVKRRVPKKVMLSIKHATLTTSVEKERACDVTSDMMNHQRIPTDEKDVACNQCSFRSIHAKGLKRHMLTHSGEKSFACGQCSFRSNQKSSLKKHMPTHTGEKPFACDDCGFRSIQKSNLKRHMSKHTLEKPFACVQCTFRSSQKCDLKKHMLIHTGEKPFACGQCSFRSNQRSNLESHMLTHTGEKPFACDLCSFRSIRRSDLDRHMLTHTGEKPFACDQCAYKGRDSSYLKSHMLTHTGEKPFACDQCSYRGRDSSYLKKHMLTHTGEKPVVCSKCKYRSRNNSNFKKHMRTHENFQQFEDMQADNAESSSQH